MLGCSTRVFDDRRTRDDGDVVSDTIMLGSETVALAKVTYY